MTARAYIGIGSNLNQPERQVEHAILFFNKLDHTTLVAQSNLYYSKPMGPKDQPDFVNAVVAIDTELSAHALLDHLLAYEKKQGRVPEKKWGPRIIDLDILLFGHEVIRDERLTVPHPGLTERDFVIYPLYELAPDLVLPSKQSIKYVFHSMARRPPGSCALLP